MKDFGTLDEAQWGAGKLGMPLSHLPQGLLNVDRGAPTGMPVDFQKVHFAPDIPQKLTSFGFPISSEKAGTKILKKVQKIRLGWSGGTQLGPGWF